MSALRLYEDSSLTQLVSRDGDFSNPDQESSLDGTGGQIAQAALWAAPGQTTLAADITTTDGTSVTLSAPRFADTDYPIIVIGSEKMLITAGHGSANLTVTRGYHNTTAATHTNGDPVRLAYDCTSITVDCTDNEGTDESGWMSYCGDSGGSPDGSWEAPHSIDDIDHDGSEKLWRRIVVPTGTAAQNKQDLVHRLAFTATEIS
ncbi:MAG: hypothetical protein U9P14_11900 [Gemmatimonadota bacterium]|nr:hypothetical protein [Gemmatimonadota bacterium]